MNLKNSMTMTNKSQKAPRYGAQVEKHVRERYGLTVPESGRQPWFDAADDSGTKWEIKGAMRKRSDGSPGRVRIFREPHQQLSRVDGYYGFAAYRPRGRGVEILATNAVRAREMRFEWGPSEHSSPNREQQQKLRLSRVMQI